MNDRTFAKAVYVRIGEHLIQELATLDEAIDFLDEWPRDLRAPGFEFETACKACNRAYNGEVALEVARHAIVDFAKSAMILEEVDALPPFPVMANSNSSHGGPSL